MELLIDPLLLWSWSRLHWLVRNGYLKSVKQRHPVHFSFNAKMKKTSMHPTGGVWQDYWCAHCCISPAPPPKRGWRQNASERERTVLHHSTAHLLLECSDNLRANKNRELNHEIYITLLTVVWTPSNRYDKPWAAKYFDYFVRAETQSHYITIKKLNNTTTPCREINTKMSSENRYVENELIGGMHTFANSLQQQHNLPAPGGYEWWSAFPHQQTGSSETIFHELQSRSVFRLTSLSNKLNEFELNALKLLQL